MKSHAIRRCTLITSLLCPAPTAFAENAVTADGASPVSSTAWDAPHNANPILPGYYSGASAVQFEGKTHISPTIQGRSAQGQYCDYHARRG